jgi:hypothetical protein
MTDTTTTMRKVPINIRSLVGRINRRLEREGRRLHAVRGDLATNDLGDFYVLDTAEETIVEANVDPEQLGRKLGALRRYEMLIADAEKVVARRIDEEYTC